MPADEQKLVLRVNDFSDGVNSYFPPDRVADNGLVDAQNCLVEQDGVLTRRPAVTRVGSRSSDTAGVHDHLIDILVAGKGIQRKIYLLWADGGATQTGVIDFFDGSSTDPTAWYGEIGTGLWEINHGSMTWGHNAADTAKVYVAGAEAGFNSGLGTLSITDAGTKPSWAILSNTPELTRFIGSGFGRLFSGGAIDETGHVVYYSFTYDGDTWDTATYRISFWTQDGQPVTGIGFFRHDAVFIGLAGSCYLLFANTADEAGLFTLHLVSNTVGVGAHKTIQSVGQDLFFMDQYGNIQSLMLLMQERNQIASRVEPISLPLMDVTKTIDEGDIFFANAAFYKENYWVSFKTSSGWKIYTFNVTNQRWSGPHTLKNSSGNELQVWAMTTAFGDLGTSDVTDRSTHLYFATDDGQGAVTSLQVYELDESTVLDDGATAITMSATTKAYNAGQPHKDIVGDFLEIEFETVSGATGEFTVEVRKDFGEWEKIGDVEYTEGVEIERRQFTLNRQAARNWQFRFKSSDANTSPRILSSNFLYSARPVVEV